MEAIQPYQSQSKISCLLFVAVQRYALHDYSGLIKVRSVPSSVAALMIIGGTLCTELQTRYKNSSGVWLLSVVFHILYYLHKLKSCVCSLYFSPHILD